MKIRTRIISVVLLAAVAAGIVLLYPTLRRGRVTVVSAGPLDIRLWGIRPSAGDTIYDPKGRKILDTLGNTGDFPTWKDDSQRCDFIFELPETNEPPLFFALPEISDSRGDRLMGSGSWRLEYYKGKRLLWITRTFPRTFRKSILFDLYKVDARVNAIGLKLEYYHGPPGAALFMLAGPFRRPCEMTSDDDVYKVTFTQEADAREYQFELTTKKNLHGRIHVIAYDNLGRRHRASVQSWSSAREGTRATYNVPEVPVEMLRQIAFGENPSSITFQNIGLDPGGRRKRSHAEYLDKMAKRLDREHSAEELANNRFKDADEAFKVIDVVRGAHILRAGQALMGGGKSGKRLNPAELSPKQAQRLKQTLNRWTQAIDPEIRATGAWVGLFCKWPEFIEPALKLLDYRNPSRSRTQAPFYAAYALYHYSEGLDDRHIERIKESLLRHDDNSVINYLKRCLSSTRSPARIKALWELADSDRAWLWWHAISTLLQWRELDGEYDSLPEKIKPRLFLVAGADGFSDPDQIAPKAYSLLPEMLSAQLLQSDSGVFYRVLGMLAENLDRKKATAAMIRCLRGVEDYRLSRGVRANTIRAVNRIVKHINLWYGMNIGGLGSDIAKLTSDRQKYDWSKITAEAIEWNENRSTAVDANSAR